MPDVPPIDPADHAGDFANRYADRLDEYSAVRMEELGVPSDQIGASDYERGVPWRAFFPDEREAGGVSPGGLINVDSGVLNPDQLQHLGAEASDVWRHARLRDRIDATIAHEFEEARLGTHEAAVEHAPDTDLPIRPAARELARKIRDAERGL